jgi:hypothetical protein
MQLFQNENKKLMVMGLFDWPVTNKIIITVRTPLIRILFFYFITFNEVPKFTIQWSLHPSGVTFFKKLFPEG